MVYRAKCTHIIPIVESRFNTNKHHIVKDATDYYIEVDNEDIADRIEMAEKYQKALDAQIRKIDELICE